MALHDSLRQVLPAFKFQAVVVLHHVKLLSRPQEITSA